MTSQRNLTKTTSGNLGKIAFEHSPGEIAGPIKNLNSYCILKIIKYIPAEIGISYEENKNEVRMDMEFEMKKKKLREWQEKQRENIEIVVHEDVLSLTLLK